MSYKLKFFEKMAKVIVEGRTRNIVYMNYNKGFLGDHLWKIDQEDED